MITAPGLSSIHSGWSKYLCASPALRPMFSAYVSAIVYQNSKSDSMREVKGEWGSGLNIRQIPYSIKVELDKMQRDNQILVILSRSHIYMPRVAESLGSREMQT